MRITVIIPTLNRPESLAITLEHLAAADRTGVECELVVVDNAASAATQSAAHAFEDRIPVKYLTESRRGKSHCLNRALDTTAPGDVTAVLDDDMSVERDWWRGVAAITRRWPDKGFYSGSSYVIWPEGVEVPSWARRPSFRGWAFSVVGTDGPDRVVPDGRWVSGNHFWIRSDLLRERRFEVPSDISLETHIEMSEPKLMLDLAEAGFGGVIGADAVAGHRIQADLFSLDRLRKRAIRVGRGFGEARMRPYRSRVKQARLMRRHPIVGRAFCACALVDWWLLGRLACLCPVRDSRLEYGMRAIERTSNYAEILRIAAKDPEYRLFGNDRD